MPFEIQDTHVLPPLGFRASGDWVLLGGGFHSLGERTGWLAEHTPLQRCLATFSFLLYYFSLAPLGQAHCMYVHTQTTPTGLNVPSSVPAFPPSTMSCRMLHPGYLENFISLRSCVRDGIIPLLSLVGAVMSQWSIRYYIIYHAD